MFYYKFLVSTNVFNFSVYYSINFKSFLFIHAINRSHYYTYLLDKICFFNALMQKLHKKSIVCKEKFIKEDFVILKKIIIIDIKICQLTRRAVQT